MPRLTKRLIENAALPKQGQAFLRDDLLRGFGVRLTPGSKSFFLEKLIHRQVRRLTLGRFGEMTLDEARAIAKKKMVEIDEGRDPVAERRQRSIAPTFRDLEQMYLTRHAALKKSRANDEAILNHHLAYLRPRKLVSITRDEIARLHSRIGTEPSSVIRPGRPVQRPMPRTANQTLALIRSMWNLGMDWGLIPPGPNPCLRIKKFPEISRERFVKPDELPRLWKAMGDEPNPYVRIAFLVGLLTGARRNEVLAMRWEDLDLSQGLWVIPSTKAGRSHVVPLPRPAREALIGLPRLEGNPFVFCGRWGRSHLVNVSKPWQRIRTEAGLEDVRIHDLRRTLGSWLVAAGASLPLIGKALNHTNVSTTQVYARLQLDPVRLALEANAERMLTVIDAARVAEEDQSR
ncbi:MAG: site-specific integrase [Nitrospira defluvii]|nr:site-specific integrase [Nitrospira defluvii]